MQMHGMVECCQKHQILQYVVDTSVANIQQQDQNAQWSSTKTSKFVWNLDESFYNASFSHNFANTQNKVFDNVNKYLCRYRKKPRNSLP